MPFERSANLEAISHLTKGLEVLKTLPDTPERLQHRAGLADALGQALLATKGNGAPEVGHKSARARELCQQVGETPQLFPVLWGLWYFISSGGVTDGAGAGGAAPHLAQRLRDPALLLEAHGPLEGPCTIWESSPPPEHLEQVSPSTIPSSTAPTPFSTHGTLEWLPRLSRLDAVALGYPDQACRAAMRH